MFSKKLVSGLILMLLGLNFTTYATEVDLEKIIQAVSCEYFSEDYDKFFEKFDAMEDVECKTEMDELSNCVKIRLSKKNIQILEIWMEIFSKSDVVDTQKKGNNAVIGADLNIKPLIKDLRNIFLGFLYKFFLVDGSKSLEDSDCTKSCGCKVLKNKDYGCTEIYICKEHSRVVETWGERELKLIKDSNIDAKDETVTDACDCMIKTDRCGCQSEPLNEDSNCETDITLEDIRLEDIYIFSN